MRRVLPLLLALALGVCAAVMAACGGTDHLVPSANATGLQRQLDDLKSSIESGACDAADTHLAQLTNGVANLPESVDSKLRARLQSGVDNLARKAPAACQNVDTVTESVPATTTVEPPPDIATEPQAQPAPQTTPVEPPPDTTPATTPDQPTSPDTGNGNGNGNGNSNGNGNGSGGLSAP